MVDFTITIVAYRNYDDILNAIETIRKFTSASVTKTLFVVDNSCYENSNAEKKKFVDALEAYDFVTYLDTGKNLGFGVGHNYVLDRLDSKLHVIMNPDILLVEDSLSQIQQFMQDENIGMCVPRLTDETGKLQQVYRRDITLYDMFVRMFAKNICKKRYAYHTMQDCDLTKPLQIPFAQGSFLVIRTELLRQLNGFDDRYFMYMEDADLCKRVNQVSRLVLDPGTTVVHKWERGSHKSGKLMWMHVRSMVRYFGKWGVV